MKKQIIMAIAMGMCLGASTAAWSYDAATAESYAKLFAPVTGAGAEKELHYVKPDGFIKDLKSGKKFVALDIRTPEETAMFAMTMPGTLIIPMDQLFKKENLDRIPTDTSVMVVCKSGARAAAAGTSLRHLGFNNVYVLKGGLEELSKYYGPKEAYTDPNKEPAAK